MSFEEFMDQLVERSFICYPGIGKPSFKYDYKHIEAAFQSGSDARREKDAQKVENAPPAKSHLMLAAIAKDIREGE